MSISVVLFKSKSCAACGQVEPIYKSAVELYRDKIKSETVDITENLDAAINNGVMTVPTIIFFKDGKEVKRFAGPVSKEKLEETINALG
ncbi:MAG TPA: thioredoxin [Elusimicrobia bacterium]|nr:thioredoxin [Elusimicrobiota bacterium]